MSDQSSFSSPSRMPDRLHAYGWGVRTALRDNATAYGFSISVTAAYGLIGSLHGTGTAAETVLFAFCAAGAFVLVNVCFMGRFRSSPFEQDTQVLTLASGFDALSVGITVAVAYALAHLPTPWAWPATGLGTVVTYLLVGGLDEVLAELLSRRTSFGLPRDGQRGER